MAPILSNFDEVNKIISGYPILYYKVNEGNIVLDCLFGDFTHESFDMQNSLGKSIFDVIPLGLKQDAVLGLQQVREQGKVVQETFLTVVGNDIYQCASKYIPLVDGEIILIFNMISVDNKLDLISFNQIKYTGMLDLCPSMICIIDFKTCKVLEANDLFLKYFRLSEDELVDKDIADFVTEEYLDVVEGIMLTLKDQHVIKDLYMEVYKKDQQKSMLEVSLIGIYDKDEIHYTLCVAKDAHAASQVDDMKEMFVENMRLMSEVVEFDKIRTEFFSNISHDFKTPINVLLGALKLMDLHLGKLESSPERDKIARLHKSMRLNSYRLLRLVSNLLDLTKIDAGKIQLRYTNCDFVRLTRGITMSISDYASGKKVNLEFQSQLNEKLLACDPEKVERILLNLLSNAIKFTKAEDTITVTVAQSNNEVILSVRDTGLGIKEEDQRQIFERFKQVDEQFKRNTTGTGIGLSLVRSLVEMHQGRIWFESCYGEGTEFFIAFPDRVVEQVNQYYNGFCDTSDSERVVMEFSDIYLAE